MKESGRQSSPQQCDKHKKGVSTMFKQLPYSLLKVRSHAMTSNSKAA